MQLMLDFADRVDALAAQVSNATMTEEQAYAAYDGRRMLVPKVARELRNREQIERQFEIDDIKQSLHPNCQRYGVC